MNNTSEKPKGNTDTRGTVRDFLIREFTNNDRKQGVNAPYKRLTVDEIIEDPILVSMVRKFHPDAVIEIPEFPDIRYLRTQNFERGVGINADRIYQYEKGVYYDRNAKQLIDLELREDSEIVPTVFAESMKILRQRRDVKTS